MDFVVSTSALVLCISLSTMVRMTQKERAIGQGYLKPDDVLVLDNAVIHFGGVNDDLGQCL
jgi:predicted phosphatase